MERPEAGLCASCRHGRLVVSARGSRFQLCALSARDPRFVKYPRLPVLQCAGFARGTGGKDAEAPSPPEP